MNKNPEPFNKIDWKKINLKKILDSNEIIV